VSLALSSFKLRFHDEHVRAVPARDERGCPFAGPGVDVRGEAARVILAAAAPMIAWLAEREPGIEVRSLALSRAPDGTPLRVLATLTPAPGDRPRVVRIDPPHAADLAACARDVEERIGEACVAALRRRAAQPDG